MAGPPLPGKPDGTIRYDDVSEHPAERTYVNWVRCYGRKDYENPFGG